MNVMRWIRAALRLLALTTFTAVAYLLLMAGVALSAPWRGRKPRKGPGLRTWMFQRWSRGVLVLLGVRLETHGTPPRAPFVLVSNHLSYLDVLVLASRVPCVFVAQADVAGWPAIGRLCRAADTVFIDRGNKRDIPRVMHRIRGILTGGRGVVLFPEGTTSAGADVGPFRPSLLETAAAADLPVSYAALSYRTPRGSVPAHLAVCWWGDMPFGGHFLELLGLPEIRATLSFGESGIQEGDRKILARRLHHAVERRFQPVV